MQIGEQYMVRPECSLPDTTVRKQTTGGVTVIEKVPMKGTVVYVHPMGRYATLEFQGVSGNPRECFFPEQLTERNRLIRKRR